MKKLLPLMLGLFFHTLASGQCLEVNIGIIVDQFADPCKGPITLDAEHPGMNYLWNTGQTSQKIVVTHSGIYTVIVDDGTGCTGKDSVRVTFLANPTIDLGPDPAPQCGGCISLDAGNQQGGDIIWSTGATTRIINYCNTGTNKVWAKVTNNLGCFATDTITLTIKDGYKPALGPDIVQCGDSTILTAANLAGSYLWNTGDTTSSITVHQSGTYYVTVSSMNGCDSSDQVSDTIAVVLNPEPVINLGADPAPQCGGCIALDAGVHTNASIAWSTGATSQKINYCTTGVHKIWAKVTDNNHCSASDTLEVTIKSGYNPSLGPDITKCGDYATLTAANLGGNYLWSTGETTRSIDVHTSGTYWVTVTDIGGCSPSDQVADTIKVTFQPVLAAPASITDNNGPCGNKTYSVTPVPGATAYHWNVPEGWIIVQGQGSSSITVNANEHSQGNISVSATNGIPSCESRQAALETRATNYTLHVPNTFSPNGDGINDVWVIRNIEYYPDNELVVLNRWGNEVFRTKTYMNNWDGSGLNEGTYYYKLRIKFCDEEKVITDYVTIVR